MRFSSLLLSLAAALCYVMGGGFMKLSNGFVKVAPGAAAVGLFAVGAILQTFTMKQADLGVAYVFILGLEAVLAVVIGSIFFNESVSAAKLSGVALIIVGFAFLHVGS